MNRELLEKSFEPSQIKQREGNFGKKLDYIEGHAVIQRLNDALDAQWSFTILEHHILKETDEVMVLGQLKTGDVIKTQFGSSRITRARETGEPISLADDYKAASTDSLKKCATMLGVGLHLYNSDKGKPSAPKSNAPRENIKTPEPKNDNGDGNGGNGNGRLSAKQFKYILHLNDEAGHSRQELDAITLKMFGVVAQHLTKSDASALIQNLLPN
jgi:hypothetical protein